MISLSCSNSLKMFGAMHFIYYIYRSIATKVDSTYLDYIDQQHITYMSCGRWRAQTNDI